MQKPGKVSKQ
jgi:hypothetical protein